MRGCSNYADEPNSCGRSLGKQESRSSLPLLQFAPLTALGNYAEWLLDWIRNDKRPFRKLARYRRLR